MAKTGFLQSLGAALAPRAKAMSPVSDNRGWVPMIRESYPGAWQENVEVRAENVLAYHAVFACMTLIASDISKLRVKLVARDSGGIWSETTNPAYSPVLRKPNTYQTRVQFWESWILSKLARGNAYILKQRDGRGIVVALHVLDPARVTVLISDSGDVFYEVQPDNLNAQAQQIVIPAREIVHDRFNCLFHPLVGLSPIFANGLAATQGLNIQKNSATFFGNSSMPGGILIAPGAISDDAAKRLKGYWEANYSGRNAGKIAVLGDNLKFEALAMKAVDSQMLEQLRWTAEVVCSTFHVPPYKIGVGAAPTYNSAEKLNIQYYSDCLQSLIEAAEACLDEGMGLDGVTMGVEFDHENLWRMDTASQMDALEKTKSVLTLDERRARLDKKPITGGSTVYLQQQDHSIEAITARDRMLIEQANNPQIQPEPDAGSDLDLPDDTAKALFEAELRKAMVSAAA
ncbi:phage portal protein [Paenirhodobacter populi]|uniref:Phage portal protein n=1 Tax=Paenirhodobacter populi TaxID=2306993 RepID=A0A443IPI4_9RHOB|nr:phage portal protein [Sinirhodobacter populi]RWR08499.1 phage portal protein [Sinirhodobacter populi]